MNTTSSHYWWHCYNEPGKQRCIDNLSRRARDNGKRIAIMGNPEQLIGNLTVRENIELISRWLQPSEHLAMDETILHACLQPVLQGNQTLQQFIALQGALLAPAQRRRVGLARAICSQANCIIIDMDESLPDPLADERLALAQHLLPGAELHIVSLRQPDALPALWRFTTTEFDQECGDETR